MKKLGKRAVNEWGEGDLKCCLHLENYGLFNSPCISAWEFGLDENWEHFNQMLHDLSVLLHFTQGRTLNCLCNKQQVNVAKLF